LSHVALPVTHPEIDEAEAKKAVALSGLKPGISAL